MQINRTKNRTRFHPRKIHAGCRQSGSFAEGKAVPHSCEVQEEEPWQFLSVNEVIWVISSTPERFVLPYDEWDDVKPCW